MAISPVFLAMKPNVMGACIWQIFMTVGQVLWSPRQDSWIGKIFYTFVYWIVEACTLMLSCPKPTLSLFMCRTPGQMKRIESTTSTTPKSCSKYALKIAGLAPTGVEGLFFAVGSSRALLAPLGDLAMGMMNEKYNANCPGESPLWHYHFKSLCYMKPNTQKPIPRYTFYIFHLVKQSQTAEINMGISAKVSSILAKELMMLFNVALSRRAAIYFSVAVTKGAQPLVPIVHLGSQAILQRFGTSLRPLQSHHRKSVNFFDVLYIISFNT